MQRIESSPTVKDHSTGPVNHEFGDDSDDDVALQQASARHYERRQKLWADFYRGDWWIAIGLYLIISSVAFVAA